MALTEGQEQKIRYSANAGFKHGVLTCEPVTKAVVAGIKAYDEIQDMEEFKAAVNAIDEKEPAGSDGNDDCYVVFRPFVGSLAGVRVYKSEEEMLKKLSEEFNVETVIDRSCEFGRTEFGWEHEHFVYFNDKKGKMCKMGYCDCKTFKRG